MRQSMRGSSVKGPEKHFSKPEKTSKSLSRSVPETFGRDLALERYLDGKKHQLFFRQSLITRTYQVGGRVAHESPTWCRAASAKPNNKKKQIERMQFQPGADTWSDKALSCHCSDQTPTPTATIVATAEKPGRCTSLQNVFQNAFKINARWRDRFGSRMAMRVRNILLQPTAKLATRINTWVE